MSRIYLAARYSRRLEVLGYAKDLEGLGHEVVSTWLSGKHETRPGIDANGTADERAMWAEEDCYDLSRANCFILFTETPQPGGRARGGCFVELGYFLGKRSVCWSDSSTRVWPCIVVGPTDSGNVFLHLPSVERYPDWPMCLAKLSGGS